MTKEPKLPGKEETGQQEELAAYEKLRASVKKMLSEARDNVHAETIKNAVERASQELKSAGRHSSETINKVAHSVRKDFADVVQKMGPKWETFSEKSADVFHVWRDRSGVFLGQASSAAGEWLRSVGEKYQHANYHSGEMSSAGTFRCVACDGHTVLTKSGRLPACAKCNKTEFRRL